MTHEQLIKQALSDPAVRAEYDALEEEFTLLSEKPRVKPISSLGCQINDIGDRNYE